MVKKAVLVSTFLGAGLVTFASANDPLRPEAVSIQGNYVEVRTADVWTGPCFANGEVNLVGKEGILAWEVTQGGWQGVRLAGLRVVAVVKANATLGDPFGKQLPAKSVIIVDKRATEEQSEALVQFAREMGGDLLQDVVWVRKEAVELELTSKSGFASVKAGDLVEIKTRALNHHDMHCGNEFIYYPPLTEGVSARPAYALAHRFQGDGLGTTWSCPSKRSAFVGTFAR